MGNFSKELKDIENVCPSSHSGTFFKKVKGDWGCLSFISVWDMEKGNCLHQKKFVKLAVSHPYETWGHQVLTEMIFMSCKEILEELLRV